MHTKLMKFGAVALLTAVTAGPAFAQTATGPGKSTAPTVTSTGNTTDVVTPAGKASDNKAADNHNGAMSTSASGNTSAPNESYDPNADARASKLVGSTIYNDQNQSVGTLDDILIARDNKQPVRAVISVGGFLGIGNKLVEIDYSRLQFQDNNKVVLPNASKDELNKMQNFTYNNNTNNNNSSNSMNNNANGVTNPAPGVPAPAVPPAGTAAPHGPGKS